MKSAYCNYYGRLNGIKPKKGLPYFMINEYVKEAFSKEKEIVIKDLNDILEDFKKESIRIIKSDLRSLTAEVMKISSKVDDLVRKEKEREKEKEKLEKKEEEKEEIKEEIKEENQKTKRSKNVKEK